MYEIWIWQRIVTPHWVPVAILLRAGGLTVAIVARHAHGLGYNVGQRVHLMPDTPMR